MEMHIVDIRAELAPLIWGILGLTALSAFAVAAAVQQISRRISFPAPTFAGGTRAPTRPCPALGAMVSSS